MCLAYGALSINANSTSVPAPFAAAKFTQGWAAHGVSQHGVLDVVPSVSNSRLTCLPGVYRVTFNAEAETDQVSGTSGDGVGNVSFQLYQAGVAVSGAIAKMNAVAVDRPQTIAIHDIVEITKAQLDAGTNYLEIYFSGGDASGNDVTVRNARFIAERIA